ncbi:MdtA/MuxA family multidrug efflux RND transporter periplasmic adaptor subunit [Rhodoferax sp. GW822-FHT02A01]|uniref:MdtA/MuxA family multidrug efflux RND transporter periplasmic adaptor subunit n=1 Tax=Rhodoferax sp. GW822-FHT02A01 TaxID=3141537 RepID=UPI00315D301A
MSSRQSMYPSTPSQPSASAVAGSQSGKLSTWALTALVVLAAGGAAWWKFAPHASDTAATGQAAGGPPGMGPGGGSRRFGGSLGVQPVSVMAARLQDIRVTASAIGSLTASNTAVVHAQVSGTLQSILFQEGQQVQAGQLLAQIDPRSFQATVSQAEGALARDTAQLDNARLDLQRYKDLVAKDAAPKQQVDTQLALVRQLEGTVKVDRGALDSAQLQLSYTKVVAPTSGRVGLKQSDIGNVVQPADTNGIVSIAQTRPIALVFSIPAAQVPVLQAKLKAKQPLRVEAWDKGSAKLLATGQVATIDNAIDASTDTIKVKALFPNKDDALFPNQSVSVRLQLDTLSNVLAVPQAAVLRGAQGFYVYVVGDDNTVSTRVIKPGVVDGDWMAVEGAVQPGEKIVIDGVDRLRNGAKVEVIVPNAKPGGGGNWKGGDKGGKAANGAAPAASGAAAPAPAALGPGTRPAPAGAPPQPAAGKEGPAENAGAAGADDAAAAQRRAFFQSLSPEDREKLRNMTPEERQAWREKMRAKLNPQ